MLSPDNERFIENALASGDYSSRVEALDAAVSQLRETSELLRALRISLDELPVGGPRILFADGESSSQRKRATA